MITSIYANINFIDNIADIIPDVEQADKHTLIIFDVDHVLIMPTDEYTLNRNPLRKNLLQQLQKGKSADYIKNIYGITAAKAEWQLVDSQILHIIEIIDRKKISAIALTSLYTGQFGKIIKLEDWRVQQLQKFNINFNNWTPFSKEFTMHHMRNRGGVPLYKDGIIFTAQISKATILKQVLQYYNYYPKKIIFIDDELKNVKRLDRLCKTFNIEYHGYVYKAVSKMQTPKIDRQKEISRFQILRNHQEWLSYQELEDRLNNLEK